MKRSTGCRGSWRNSRWAEPARLDPAPLIWLSLLDPELFGTDSDPDLDPLSYGDPASAPGLKILKTNMKISLEKNADIICIKLQC